MRRAIRKKPLKMIGYINCGLCIPNFARECVLAIEFLHVINDSYKRKLPLFFSLCRGDLNRFTNMSKYFDNIRAEPGQNSFIY